MLTRVPMEKDPFYLGRAMSATKSMAINQPSISWPGHDCNTLKPVIAVEPVAFGLAHDAASFTFSYSLQIRVQAVGGRIVIR